MTAFAGLDVGTSGGRCLIVGEEGELLASARRAWSAVPDESGFPTLDTDAVMRALADALAEATQSAGVEPVAIGVTSQRSGVVFSAENGDVLLAGPNADGRSVLEGLALEREHGDAAYRIGGRLPVMLYLPARFAWLKKNRPADAARVASALSFGDWVVAAITGARATDRSQAAESLVYDVEAGRYSDELLGRFDVPREILPAVLESGAPAGEARAAGFPVGVPVVCAGGDTQSALLGAGVLEPGTAAVVAGTTMLCDVVTDASSADPAGALWCSPHAVAGRFVREAHCGEAGAAVRWFADLLAIDDEQVADLAASAEPGAGGVRFLDPWPSTVSDFTLVRRGGFAFPVPLLALGRGRADMARAVLEGIAFGACAGLDLLGPIRRLTVTGGVARSRAVAEAVAGVRGEQVLVPADPAGSSARGAAIAAAATHHGGTTQAAAAMADRGTEVAPVQAHGYPALYAEWREAADGWKAGAMRISDLNP